MANIKISALPNATLVKSSDVFPIVQDGVTKKLDVNYLAPFENGQVIIGSNESTPVASTLSAGPGININNSSGSITISTTATQIASRLEYSIQLVILGVSLTTADAGAECINSIGPISIVIPANAPSGTSFFIQRHFDLSLYDVTIGISDGGTINGNPTHVLTNPGSCITLVKSIANPALGLYFIQSSYG